VTINLEQNHKRWTERHPLISAELAALKPDLIAFNEVCVPIQAAKALRDMPALVAIRSSVQSAFGDSCTAISALANLGSDKPIIIPGGTLASSG